MQPPSIAHPPNRQAQRLSLLWLFSVMCSLLIPLLPVSHFGLPAFAQTATPTDRKAEADRLFQQGIQQAQINQFREAFQSWEQALQIYREIKDRQGEAASLNNLGNVYFVLEQYNEAIEYHQQSLSIKREIGDRQGEAISLGTLGDAYDALGQYNEAIEYYQQSWSIIREIGDREKQAKALNNLGSAYFVLGQYNEAIEYHQQSLLIAREIGDRQGEANSLGNLGIVHDALGQYSEAIEYLQQSLSIAQEIGNRGREATLLGNLGNVYHSLGQYSKAIEYLQQSLSIKREIGDRQGEAISLGNLGNVYQSLGQYNEAIEYYQQSLFITREIGSRPQEAQALGNLGLAYSNLGQYNEAIEYHQQSLSIAREIRDRQGEAVSLGNLGVAYYSLDQYQQAIDYYEQHLAIAKEIGDRRGEGNALGNFGNAYANLGQYQQAIEYYQQGLVIHQEIGNRAAVGTWLSNIGILLETQNQPELAIVFLKQSVNVREQIRQDNRGLSQELQQSYVETVSNTYRRLADLLLQENRVLEAQRVLDLLKVQELEDYLRNVRGTTATASGVENWQPEDRILELYKQVLLDGEVLAQLRQKNYAQLTPDEQQRLSELSAREGELLKSFSEFIQYPDVVAAVNQLRESTQGQNVELADFRQLQGNLEKLQQNAVLFYPLILEDRLELVLVTATADAPIRYPVPVTAGELNATILQLRDALQHPSRDAKTPAHQLYQWLIQPLEPYLAAANAKTIIYAPDGALRYIPLAALHDGNGWLAQRFGVTHITAASLTNFDTAPQPQMRVLAAACAQCSFSFQVGERQYSFQDLPYTETEVKTIASSVSGTETLINQTFTPNDIQQRLGSYNIIHLATHAAFVQGQPSESFIVFGSGEQITLPDVLRWNLSNADLVVLSACETAVTEQQLGNGIEILGFGYQMQTAGAKAALASLWKVNDGGTQILMNAFYTALLNGNTKAEAMQKAQIALITSDFSALGGPRSDVTIVNTETGQPISNDQLNHPYYWAPFILIGNGL
jgi:CHAT domain-containing protein/tetratricopeptide (TPR) repeat protein